MTNSVKLQFGEEGHGPLVVLLHGRVAVKVIEGEGRVYAYGSNVDNRTADPTYIPGQ